MKTKKSIKSISSILIFLIIFSLTLSLSAGCTEKEVSTETGAKTVDDPEGYAAFYTLQVALNIMLAAEDIKKEKAKGKAAEEVAEAIKEMVDAERDYRKDFLENYIFATDLILIESANKHVFDVWAQLKKDQDLEVQKTSVTTAPQAQENTQTTEKEKPTGTITLKIDITGASGEIIIDFDAGAVSGSISYEDEISTYAGSFSGSIDLETNIITASGTGAYTIYGEASSESISIEGVLSSDYKSVEGSFTNDEGEFPLTGTAQ
jgi:hypothetical protein